MGEGGGSIQYTTYIIFSCIRRDGIWVVICWPFASHEMFTTYVSVFLNSAYVEADPTASFDPPGALFKVFTRLRKSQEKKTFFISVLSPYLESLLHVPYAQCFVVLLLLDSIIINQLKTR